MSSPTLTKRPAHERGHADHGWLHTWHTFSFAGYHDPEHMGFRTLRVINDDIVEPGQGFGTHPHRDMEIFTYIIDGELEHKDSMGNGRVIKTGEFQYMSAGSGVMHSEFNPSNKNPVHLLQIWILPNEKGGRPRYADMDTNGLKRDDGLALFASGDGRDGSFQMRQNAEIFFGKAKAGKTVNVPFTESLPNAWLHLIHGEVEVLGETLEPGDGAAIQGGEFAIQTSTDSEFLLFRLD